MIAELAQSLPNYLTVEEPYYEFLEAGHVFAETPTTDDLELLIRSSCTSITRTTEANVLFDRAPLDYWAYLVSARRSHTDFRQSTFEEIAQAIARLDLIVFVPIEKPDRINVDASEGLRQRRRVDALLRQVLVDDSLGLGAPTLEVTGTATERSRQVLTYVAASR